MRSLLPVWRFLKHYWQFSLAFVALITALILQFTGAPTIAHWILGVVSLILTVPLLWGMWDDIKNGSYGIDILAATAIVTSVLLHEYWAAIIVVLMLTGGEALEDYAERRAKSELDALLKRAPQKAHVIKNRKTVDVKVSQVHVGDKLEIRPGEVVPVDAEILEGSADFDESSLTGESMPQQKTKGDQILSGSINQNGLLTVRALHDAEGSQYQQIIKLVRAAQGSQAPFVRMADRYSIPFTIAAYLIAGTVWYISGDAIRFLEVIVVATPCPLLLAAPIALISGMSRASKYGIIVKTGSALERLAQAQTIAFDKTGTLTIGQPVVDAITTFGSFTKNDVLGYAASLEQGSNHVLANAIVEAATKRKTSFSKAKHVQETAGHGLRASVKSKHVLVGHFNYMQDNDVELPAAFKQASVKQTATYVAVDNKLAGVITFKDELRPETKPTLQHLRRLGLKNMLMLTGDHEAAAKTIAKSAGIQNYVASALPGDKLRAVESIPERPVIFVGDGVNDAPVLTASDVGIALGARGSTAASESADLVIMQDDLTHVARARAVALRTFKIARQSILVGIGLSLVLMLIFATGKFTPVLGALLQEVVDVVVIFNALRAHSVKDELA
ncbi:MAG TPA: heavy metal translocating P-type ATPase [Candidatus Saccharimonadales bacterium]|nr:heavy metal translocating P-type ATPase [Candidatus Saccharimonadales bacterium]